MPKTSIKEIIQSRKRGNGIPVTAYFPDEIFTKFHTDAEEQTRSESNLLIFIVSEYYKNKQKGFFK